MYIEFLLIDLGFLVMIPEIYSYLGFVGWIRGFTSQVHRVLEGFGVWCGFWLCVCTCRCTGTCELIFVFMHIYMHRCSHTYICVYGFGFFFCGFRLMIRCEVFGVPIAPHCIANMPRLLYAHLNVYLTVHASYLHVRVVVASTSFA
jgi:hypothetical protein